MTSDDEAREAEWVRAGKAGDRPKTMQEAFDDLDVARRAAGRAIAEALGWDLFAAWVTRGMAWVDREIGGYRGK